MLSITRKAIRITSVRPFISSLTRPSTATLYKPSAAGFSTCQIRYANSVDSQLKSKLQSEISFEKEMKETLDELSGFEEFFKKSPFKLHETPGHGIVTLTRQYGTENIKVTFDISDLQSRHQDDDLDRFEEEMEEDDKEEEKKPALSTQPKDDDDLEEIDDDDEEDGESHSFPLRCTVLVEKPNSGALLFETTAQDGIFMIDSVSFVKSNKIATTESAEGEYQRQVVYPGPDFRMIDQDVQTLFEGYLEERGINSAMALFLPEYCEQKDQKEYVNWLHSVANFI